MGESTADYAHAIPNNGGSANGLPAAGAGGGGFPPSVPARAVGPAMPPRPVPWEVDLNEFMLDTDLDFFSRNFDLNQQY